MVTQSSSQRDVVLAIDVYSRGGGIRRGLGKHLAIPLSSWREWRRIFVLVYLACIALIGLPILIAEILMGRAGRQNPITTMKLLASESNASQFWQVIGWMGAIAGFMILSFYGVIAGWAMAYVGDTATGDFVGSAARQRASIQPV